MRETKDQKIIRLERKIEKFSLSSKSFPVLTLKKI